MAFTVTAAAAGTTAVVTLHTPPSYTAAQVIATTSTRSYAVRGVIHANTITDTYAPLGVPITYTVRLTTATGAVQADASPVTVTHATSILTETVGDSSIDVVVIDQAPNAWDARSVAFPVIGRDLPVIAVQAAQLRAGTLRIHSADVADRDRVRTMLALGSPLVLRSPFHTQVDDVTMLVTRFQESPTVPGGLARGWEITYQAVSVEHASYQVNATTYASLTVWSGSPTFYTYSDLAGLDSGTRTYAVLLASGAW